MADIPPPAGRLAELLRYTSHESRILEIGPSHAPVAPKAQGWNSHVLDHDTREALAAKYASFTDVSAIEEVDFIWRDGSLHHAVPEAQWGSFDVLIASHVIEHFPDLIAFFASAAVLLRPRGVISLAVPDKRYCFDCFRPFTSTGEVLAARGRTLHSERALFDAIAYYTRSQGRDGWGQEPAGELSLRWPLEFAPREIRRLQRASRSSYIDTHGGVFTPSSFALLILELGHLGELDWHVARRSPARGSEFFVHLRRGVPPLAPAALTAARESALVETLLDQHEQAEALLAAEPQRRRGIARPGVAADDAAQLVTQWAQNFVLAVHGGDYETGRQLAPLFADTGLVCAVLGHSDRLHTLYCLAVLALSGNELDLATTRFKRLLTEAQLCASLPGSEALGEEFAALAIPHAIAP